MIDGSVLNRMREFGDSFACSLARVYKWSPSIQERLEEAYEDVFDYYSTDHWEGVVITLRGEVQPDYRYSVWTLFADASFDNKLKWWRVFESDIGALLPTPEWARPFIAAIVASEE